MPFEIFPQSVTIYPEDVQDFSLRATFPPVIYSTATNATINSDQTLSISTSTGGVGLILQSALAGVAGVEWTLDSQMLPTSSGYLVFRLIGKGNHSIRVTVNPTSTVVEDENSNVLETISRTVASGDIYYLQVAGNMLRLYINGTLETEYEASTAVRYPLRAQVDYSPPYVSGSPRITAPRLVSETPGIQSWQGDSPTAAIADAWTIAPTGGGTFDDSSDVWVTRFTASDKPGVYTLSAQVASSASQTATSTVVVAPLSILGATSVTLQPGEKVTFKTNYDNAQKRLIAWSVVSGGGSFSNGEYTAPTVPASPIVKAVYGDQEARISITVPAVMTIKTAANEDVTAATLGEVLTLSTNMTGTVNWTASVGTLSSSSGSTVTWTAPNQSQLVALITATNGTYTVKVEIPVLKEFAYRPNRSIKWDRKKTVLISRSEDRRRAARVKDHNNEPFEAYELTFLNRSLAELDAVHTFWDEHHPDKRFIYTDEHRDVRKVVYFDSDISHDAAATCATTYSFRLIEG